MAAVAVAAAVWMQHGVTYTSPVAAQQIPVLGCAAPFACAGVLLRVPLLL